MDVDVEQIACTYSDTLQGIRIEEETMKILARIGSAVRHNEQSTRHFGGFSIQSFRQDLRHGFRLLSKSPIFTFVAISSLALGIGANSAIFAMTKAALFDSIAVSHPNELRLFQWNSVGSDQPMDSTYGRTLGNSGRLSSAAFSWAVYRDFQQNDTAITGVTASFLTNGAEIAVNGETDTGNVEYVSGNFFTLLGVQAELGRTLLPSDDLGVGKGPVALISYSLWESRFARSPAAIGRTIEVGRIPLTVVGVVPASFLGDQINANPQIYLPLTMEPLVSPIKTQDGIHGSRFEDPENWWLHIIGRLRPGVTDKTAQAILGGILQRAARATLHHHDRTSIDSMNLVLTSVNRRDDARAGRVASTLWVLTILAVLILLLACANLANLLLARASARQREMSVRKALGAGSARLMQQALTESLLLAIIGGAIGIWVGWAGRNLIANLLSEPKPHFDGTVLWFGIGLSMFTGLLFGGVPAWQATRTNVHVALQSSGHMTTRRSHAMFGKFLVVVQVCLSAVLLVGTGLFVQTLRNLTHTRLGFEPENLILFDLALPKTRYSTPVERSAFYTQLEGLLLSLPGVLSASASADSLIAGTTSTTNFDPDGEPIGEKQAWENVVEEHFFQTMGIPVLAGRSFGPGDTEASERVAVINRQLARQFFAGGDPIGRTFNSSHIRIIGICGDIRISGLRQEPPPTYFLLTRQSPDWGSMTFEVRTAEEPTSFTNSVRDAVHSIDPQLPIVKLRTQAEQIDRSLRRERLFASLSSSFGAVALVLACMGIYGIMSNTVARRTREFGIRIALGARRAEVLRMVIGEASSLATLGIACGIGLTLGIGRFVASMLYGMQPYDPATLIGSSLLLFLLTLAAGLIPAYRAASVDAANALRME